MEDGNFGRDLPIEYLVYFVCRNIYLFQRTKKIVVTATSSCKDKQKRVRDYLRPAVRNWVRVLEASMSKRIEDEMGQRRKRCRNESLRLAALSS